MTDLLQYGRYCGWSRALEDDPVDELYAGVVGEPRSQDAAGAPAAHHNGVVSVSHALHLPGSVRARYPVTCRAESKAIGLPHATSLLKCAL